MSARKKPSGPVIESWPITDRDAWRAHRRSDVTASVAGALYQEHEYLTKWELWMNKSQRLPETTQETPQMRRGRYFERVVFDMLKDERPTWSVQMTNDTYFRDPSARIGATPDGIAYRLQGRTLRKGVIQAKTTRTETFKKWVQPDGTIQPPLWMALQAMIETYLLRAEWAALAVMVIDEYGGIELHTVEVPYMPNVIDDLKRRVAAFWRSIDEGREPPVDFIKDRDAIKAQISNGQEIDLSDDPDIASLLTERERLKDTTRSATDRLDEIEAMIAYKMGQFERAHVPGWYLSRVTQTRGDATFRVLKARRI